MIQDDGATESDCQHVGKFSVPTERLMLTGPGSSNGRTGDFESSNPGSNPGPGTP